MNSDAHSAQGYNLPGDINGFNQYGSDATNIYVYQKTVKLINFY